MSSNTWVVMNHIMNDGHQATITDDGDILVALERTMILVTVTDTFINSKIVVQTDLRPRALAIIARAVHEALVGGRVLYPEQGGVMVFDFCQAYQGVPTPFDSVCTLHGVAKVAEQAAAVTEYLGYA